MLVVVRAVVVLVVVLVVVAAVVAAVVLAVAADVLEEPAGVGVPVRSSARATGPVAARATTASAVATVLAVRFLAVRVVLMVSPGVLTA